MWGTPVHTVDINIFGTKGYYSPAKEAAKIIPPGVTIGSFQSGAFGYFLHKNLVLNLDGKVSRNARNALEQNRILEYLRSQDIKYLISWDLNLYKLLKKHSRHSKVHISRSFQFIADLPRQGKQIFRIYKIEQEKP